MQYRPHRYNTNYPVDMQTPSGPQRGRVIDVNNAGARIEGLRDLRRGDKLRLTVLGQHVDAIVKWVAGRRIGLTFRPQINNHLVDTLRYRSDARPDGRRPTAGFGFTEMR